MNASTLSMGGLRRPRSSSRRSRCTWDAGPRSRPALRPKLFDVFCALCCFIVALFVCASAKLRRIRPPPLRAPPLALSLREGWPAKPTLKASLLLLFVFIDWLMCFMYLCQCLLFVMCLTKQVCWYYGVRPHPPVDACAHAAMNACVCTRTRTCVQCTYERWHM